MTNRKQKAMEERHRAKSASPRIKDYRDTLNEEDFPLVYELIEDALKKRTCENERHYWTSTYKNGAKMFDRAMALLNSPLMKALS
jgi:hypothetical protein